MKKIAIISYSSRQEGVLSGVERFNWYLQKAIGGEIYTGTMYGSPSPEALNRRLVGAGSVDKDTLCIVDGSWGLGLPADVSVISVVHGSWTEFRYRNHNILEIDKEQNKMWHRPNTKMVAVSNASAKYLEKHHGVKADKIILNGIDTEIFKPINKINTKPVVIHCARDYNKDGQGKFERIKELLKDKFVFKFLNVSEGKEYLEYQMADIILQCSNYEGNSFFCLEGMSCGLPVVASETGLFEDTDFGDIKVGEIIPYNSFPELFVEKIIQVYENRKQYNPRQWILENATFEHFKNSWINFLKENYDY